MTDAICGLWLIHGAGSGARTVAAANRELLEDEGKRERIGESIERLERETDAALHRLRGSTTR